MLEDILKSVSPDTLAHVIKANPAVVVAALHNFKAFRSFGQAMTTEQQLILSSNTDKLNDFFKSEEGKLAISIFADEFTKFVKAQ